MVKTEKQPKSEAPNAQKPDSELEKTSSEQLAKRESELLQENAALAKETDEARAQNAELVEQIQRLQAEFINYRNRIDREQEQNKSAASEKLLLEFLTITDSLQLAIQHAKNETGAVKGDELLAGVTMIDGQMKQLLEHQGLQEIPAEGKFDPRLHEALMSVPQEGVERGTVLQTFQRGYLRNDKPFRPAKVSVAK